MLYIILMSISCFIIFANDLLLAVCFIFISDYGNNVRQKQNRATFLFEFKMGCKAARQFATSTMHLAQELLMDVEYSGGSRSFTKEMRAFGS